MQQGAQPTDDGILQRLSAQEIERIVSEAAQRWMPQASDPFSILGSVHISRRGLHVSVNTRNSSSIARGLVGDETVVDRTADHTTVLLPVALPVRSGRRLVTPSVHRTARPDPILVAALRKAHAMLETKRGMPIITSIPTPPYDRNILRLAFLAPDIQRAFLEGRQPYHLNLEMLEKIELPLSWCRQREVLGFGDHQPPCSVEEQGNGSSAPVSQINYALFL